MAEPGPAFRFLTASPRPPLDRFVESIWSVRGLAPYRRAMVLPNGALQLMVSFGEPHRVLAFGTRAAQREYRQSGCRRRPWRACSAFMPR